MPDDIATPIAEDIHGRSVHTGPQYFETVIIGTGFSGLLAAIRLQQNRLDDFVLLERSSELGGTWRDNAYPGAEVDVPTGLYSISFVPYPFTKRYAPQSELLAYTRHIIEKFHLRERAKTNQSVTSLSPESVIHFILTRQWGRLGDYHLVQ
jgi:cation diffusion facilitator CzcD-associated flavoprotein CzcO